MLAYGTTTVRPVDKIVGPRNAYVTTAKKMVSCHCAIDMLAGPTEAVVYCDAGNVEFFASDIVAQAEHAPDAVVVHVTTRPERAKQMRTAVGSLSRRNAIARQAIRKNGYSLLAGSRDQALEWVNRLAPEHLTIAESDLDQVQNAGSVFVGSYSPQSGRRLRGRS
jgi:histidinol dehydrogenase